MAIIDYFLYRLAKHWPSPMQSRTESFGAEPGTDQYNMAYAQYQFDQKVWGGLGAIAKGLSVAGRDVLEIGTGHGGIACYLGAIGARRVVGIDLNTKHLLFARQFSEHYSATYGAGRPLPLEFLEMSADQLTFDDTEFDLVLADNVMEHFLDPEKVMREAYRVLRPGGALLIPLFSSIKSKYGLHLKHGIKLPWTNLLFSEQTNVRALLRLAKDNPRLYDIYPGLSNNPQRVRDVRRYGDLNDITFAKFKTMATRVGFRIQTFRPQATPLGKVMGRVPGVRNSAMADILSVGASACLKKPGNPSTA